MTQRVSLQYATVPSQPIESLQSTWLKRLPPAKAAAILRLKDSADRNASLLGIALLGAAGAELGIDIDFAAIDFPSAGKPRLPNGPDFSIAHTHGLVACALAASGRVGLDVERAGSVSPRTVERILSDAERTPDGTARDPTDTWVMKEAVVKLAGRGIGALRSVTLNSNRASLDGETVWLGRVAVAEGYVAWLASDHAPPQVSAHSIRVEALASLPSRC